MCFCVVEFVRLHPHLFVYGHLFLDGKQLFVIRIFLQFI